MPTSDVSMKQGTHTMLKKMLLYIPIIFLSALFMQNSLPSRGLLGLIEGVNIRNSNMLVASDFLFISLVVFNLFGNCEKYLYGYGKYELLRYKKRTLILGKIILKSFLSVCVFCLTRIIIYAFLLFIRNEKIIDFTVADISNYIFTSILSLFFISILQILVELKFSSFAGVITASFSAV